MNDQELASTREFIEKKRILRATLKSRRQEIKRCIAEFGLMRSPRRLFRLTDEPGTFEEQDSEETHSRRLCKALQSLGPIFSAFGIYISSRVDLFAVSDCLEFAAIPDRGEATPISIVRELISREIGRPQEEVYPVFDEEPFESRLMFQSHRALLHNGMAVTVKVVHPEVEEQLVYDLELLPLLKKALFDRERSDFPIEDVIADFRRTLYQQINLIHEVEAFEKLALDAQTFEMLKVPMVHRDLCSPKVITIEQLVGLHLDDIIASLDKKAPIENTTTNFVFEGTRLDLNELAHNLCLTWLQGALLGSQFLVDFRPENIIIVLPNKQIAFIGGEFASLPSDAKKNLWTYLTATSTEDPDKACSCILNEIIMEKRSFDKEELQHRFREIVPFRDGGWSSNGDSNSLAEYLFVHWRLIGERCLRPQHHLLCFYRGLFQTVALAQRLAPRGDLLLEALQDLRTIDMFAQFREMVSPQQLNDNLDQYIAMMIDLPKKLDDVLTLVAEGNPRLKLRMTTSTEDRQQKGSSAVVIALLLLLAAIVLLSHHFSAAISGVWVERIGVIVFVLIGALLFRAVSRGK